jgi:hypothetical protein
MDSVDGWIDGLKGYGGDGGLKILWLMCTRLPVLQNECLSVLVFRAESCNCMPRCLAAAGSGRCQWSAGPACSLLQVSSDSAVVKPPGPLSQVWFDSARAGDLLAGKLQQCSLVAVDHAGAGTQACIIVWNAATVCLVALLARPGCSRRVDLSGQRSDNLGEISAPWGSCQCPGLSRRQIPGHSGRQLDTGNSESVPTRITVTEPPQTPENWSAKSNCPALNLSPWLRSPPWHPEVLGTSAGRRRAALGI